jgi:prephenate dehydrogenase
MKIGIIGFGNFGKFMAKHLLKKAEVVVTDVMNKKQEAEEMGLQFVSLEEVTKQKIIILAVTMESLEEMLHKIKDKISADTLILDVCSLKVFSCKLMDEILPNNVEIIGTHPLFGPQSSPNSIKDMRIVLCNVRSKRLNTVKNFCESLGLRVFITSPEEHDKQMAVSQALTHFIGQVAKKMDIKRVDLSTKTFDNLMDVIEIIKNDTPALFENMQTMNPFAKEERERFIAESKKLNENLNLIGGQNEIFSI